MASPVVPPERSQFAGADHANIYLKYRPQWPQGIFLRMLNFLLEKKSKPLEVAVDVGCGPGQSSRPLAPYFEKVIGIDVSEAQIEVARHVDNPDNVQFMVGSAETIPLADNSVDLVTCAASFHWFDYTAFFREIDRVLKPSGCVAIYSYTKIYPWVDADDTKNEKIKEVIDEFQDGTLGQYFNSRVREFDELKQIDIPYADCIRDTTFSIYKESTLGSFLEYFSTLSGYQNYIKHNADGQDVLGTLHDRVMDILGSEATHGEIKLHHYGQILLLLGRKPDTETMQA